MLEAVQKAANPGINTTIKDRYFNAACATPGMAVAESSSNRKNDSCGFIELF